MELIGSTKHFTPWISKTMSPGRSSFSMSRLYWKPEHPPPTTATRRPEPCSPSRSMVSLTMAAALSVNRTGVGTSEGFSVCGWTVWVSMGSVYSDACRRLGIQGPAPVNGEDFARDEWLLRQEQHGPRGIFRGSDAPERNALRERSGIHPFRGKHRTRRHPVHAHLGRPLQRQQPGKRGETGLRRRVVRVALPHLRGPADVENGDDAAPRSAQVRQRRLHQVEGADQVRGQHRLELFPAQALRRHLLETRRAAYEQVQPAEGARRVRDDALRITCLIAFDQRRAAQQRGGRLRLGARGPVMHRDPVAGAVQRERDRASHALRRACDQRLHPERIRSLLRAAMGKKTKATKSKAEAAAVAPPPDAEMIPISSAPLPLKQLDARALGEFFELCFADKRLLELCGELRLYSPGYRLEAMPPDQVARMLADEVRAAKDAQQLIDKAIRDALRNPVLEGKPLTADHYRDLLEVFTGDPLQHLARLAWRALIDDDEKLGEYALAAIDLGVEALDAPARTQKPRKPQLSTDVQELRKKTEEALKDAHRSAKERDSM